MKQGFALANWMICCALMLLLSLLTYALMAHWYRQLNHMHQRCDALLPLHLALDMFQKDVAQTVTIAQVTQDQCRLTSPYYQVTWRLREGKLVRNATHYDAAIKRWKKPSSSLLAQDITSGSFVPIDASGTENREYPCGVRVTMAQGSTTVKQIGYVRNGNYKLKS
jgi:type II secretory pathway component PulJ